MLKESDSVVFRLVIIILTQVAVHPLDGRTFRNAISSAAILIRSTSGVSFFVFRGILTTYNSPRL